MIIPPLASTFIGTPKQVNQLENQVVQRFRRGGPKIVEKSEEEVLSLWGISSI